MTPGGPALKNEAMLPAVLAPWAGHALYEAAHLAKAHEGSTVWLASLAPKAKLQQVMMTVAQKASFELVAVDGPSSGFTDGSSVVSGAFVRGRPRWGPRFGRFPASIDRGCCCSADGNRRRAPPAPRCR